LLDLSAHLFPMNRYIALGPTYYFIVNRKATEQALSFVNRGLEYDPNAGDLIQAEMEFSFLLGKNDEAIRAYNRLSLIAPNSKMIKMINNQPNLTK